MSNRDLITQSKMRRSVQVGYRRLARPVVWPVLARTSAPAETSEPSPAAPTFPWGMMERVRQALAEEPAPPEPASQWPKERPTAAADAKTQVRRQVVVEEASARPRPATGGVPAELGDLPRATPDAEPASGPFLQAQLEPEEGELTAAQATPPGTDQAAPSDPALAPPEVDGPAWDDRGESASRESAPRTEQAAPGPVAKSEARLAKTAPRPPSAAQTSNRTSDVQRAPAVQRAASQDAPTGTPAAGDRQAAMQPNAASLPPAYPAEEQPGPDVVMPPSSAGDELPTQPPAGREPESPPAAARSQLDVRSAYRDPRPASLQAASSAVAPVQSRENSPNQAVPAAEADSVQRMPETTPGDRAESASPPQAAPGTESQPTYQAQAQPESAGLRQPDALPSQAEPGEEDVLGGSQSEWTAAAPTLAEATEGVLAHPAEVRPRPVSPVEARQEPAPPTQVSRRPIPPVEVRRESAPPTQASRKPLSPVEVGQEVVPPAEVRQEPVSPVEAKQETVPPTEVRRMPAPPAGAGPIQRSPAPRAQPPVGDAQPSRGTPSSAKRQARGAPSAAGETVVSPGPEGGAWSGGSTQVTRFEAPAMVQTAPAADESPAPAAAPQPSGAPFTAESTPPETTDVDTLARQVYQILRRRLQVEYERNLGHGR